MARTNQSIKRQEEIWLYAKASYDSAYESMSSTDRAILGIKPWKTLSTDKKHEKVYKAWLEIGRAFYDLGSVMAKELKSKRGIK